MDCVKMSLVLKAFFDRTDKNTPQMVISPAQREVNFSSAVQRDSCFIGK